jgi:hypothetical protein
VFLPLAHAGHYIEAAIFAVPLIAVVAALTISSWRGRRSTTRGTDSPRPPAPPAKRKRPG